MARDHAYGDIERLADSIAQGWRLNCIKDSSGEFALALHKTLTYAIQQSNSKDSLMTGMGQGPERPFQAG